MPVAPACRIWGSRMTSSGPNQRQVCSMVSTHRSKDWEARIAGQELGVRNWGSGIGGQGLDNAAGALGPKAIEGVGHGRDEGGIIGQVFAEHLADTEQGGGV